MYAPPIMYVSQARFLAEMKRRGFVPPPVLDFRDPSLAHLATIARTHGLTMKAKLSAFVDKLEDVEEPYRDLYVADKDPKGKDRFRLDADGLEDVTGLKTTIATLRKSEKELKERVEVLDDLGDGVDPAEVITLGKEALERKKTGKTTPEVESVTKQLTATHAKEIAKRDAQIKGMNATLEKVLIENEVNAAAADPKIKANAKLLMPHIRSETRIVATEDPATGEISYSAVVLGEDKQARVDGKGKPLTVAARIAEMREIDDFAGAFDGTGMSGSDTPRDGGSRTPTPPAPDSRKSAIESKRGSFDYGASI